MADDRAKTRPVQRDQIATLLRETPRDRHDANTIIVVLLLRMGGGATITAQQFQEAEKLVGQLQALPATTSEGDVVHFRVNV